MRSDDDLMAAYAAGDRRAFDELFERHRAAIWGFFRRRSADPAAAEELTQDTFVGVLRAASRYRANGTFRSYLFSVAFRTLGTWRRGRRRRAVVHDEPPDRAAPPSDPASVLWVRQALAALDDGSCDAAVAVRIADEMGRRDQITDWLVANQRPPGGAALPAAVIRDYVAQTLGVEDFERRYREMLPAIIVDADAALAARVPGTPHWLVNRIHVSSLAVLDMALRYELSQPDAPAPAPASSR